MGTYLANQRYKSGGIAIDAQATIDLDDEVAAWVERDSPGTLTRVDVEDAETDLRKLTKAKLIEHGAALDPPIELHEAQSKGEMLAALGVEGD